MVKENAHSFGSVVLYGNDGLQNDRGVPRPVGVAFYVPYNGMEEAAKHPVPEGKFVKVACVHKSVPRIIE
jgi:hypothetical protein